MKLKVQIQRYCQKCNVHTLHKIQKQKAGKMSTLTRIERRKNSRVRGNRGKFSKTPAKRNKVKRLHIRSNCTTCDWQSFLRTRRANKFELLK